MNSQNQQHLKFEEENLTDDELATIKNEENVNNF
jgi:hypothetical protein